VSLAGYVIRYWVYVAGRDGLMRPLMCHDDPASAQADADAAGGIVCEEVPD